MPNSDNLRFRKDEIPSSTSFQVIYSFCKDENKKILLKNQKSFLNSTPPPTPYLIDLPPGN